MADQSPQQQQSEKDSPTASKSSSPTKGDKSLKRKLFSPGTPEDAEKKSAKVTPKRKKTTSQPGSPTLLGTPGRSIPLSERQQLALLMQMTADESPSQGPPKESTVTKPAGIKSKVNNQNNRGETSLHLAAIKGDVQLAESLISQGADVNAQDYAGWTALHEACNHGHPQLADLLLTAGAFVNALGSDDYTPLHDAAVNGHREVVEVLLKHGANPTIYNKLGKTPIDLASSSEIHGLMIGSLTGTQELDRELKGPTSPDSLDLNEGLTEGKKLAETEVTDPVKEKPSTTSSDDPYDFTQDNSNEQKITIHWASPDKTGKNSFMDITRTIPKAREQSTPVSFSSSSTSDSDLLDPQLNPIMTKALDDIKGDSVTKPTTPSTSTPKIPEKPSSSPPAPAGQVEDPTVKTDSQEEKPLFIAEDVKTTEAEPTPTEAPSKVIESVTEMRLEKTEEGGLSQEAESAADSQDSQRVTYTIPKPIPKEAVPESVDNSQESNLKLTITRLSQDSNLVCEPSEKKRDSPRQSSPPTVVGPTAVAAAPETITPQAVTAKRASVCETISQNDEKKRQSPSSQIRLQVVSTQEQGSSSDSDSIREWRILQPPVETMGVAGTTAISGVSGGGIVENESDPAQEKQPQVKERTKKHRDRSQKSHKKHKHSHSTKEETLEPTLEAPPSVPLVPPAAVESQRESPTPSKKPEESDGKDPLAREYYIVEQKQSSSGEIKKLLLRTSLPGQVTSSNDDKGVVGKVAEPDSTDSAEKSEDSLGSGTLVPKAADGAEASTGSSRGSPTVTSSDQVVGETSETKDVSKEKGLEKTEKSNEAGKSDGSTSDGNPKKVTRTLRSNSNLQNVSLHSTEEKEKEVNVSQPMTRSRRNQLEAAASANSSAQPQDQVMDSHPRKRKIAKHRQQQQEELQVPAPPPQVPLHEQANSMEQFISVRREMRKRQRANLLPVVPNMPNRFEEYLMHRKTYLLHRDPESKINRAVPKMQPPEDLNPVLRENFNSQENKRHSLRLRHQIEREKLMLAAEQEVLRVYGRGARAMANQTIPFSACMVLNDQEVYNMPEPVSQEEKGNSRQRFNGRHFHSWLHDVDEKYEKIKEDLLKRHQHEAMSLYAVQKLEWELKLQEIKMWDSKKPPNISKHVPMVEIDRDFDLLPKS